MLVASHHLLQPLRAPRCTPLGAAAYGGPRKKGEGSKNMHSTDIWKFRMWDKAKTRQRLQKKLQGVEGREVSCSVGVFFKHSTGYTQTKKRTFREVTEKMSTSIK